MKKFIKTGLKIVVMGKKGLARSTAVLLVILLIIIIAAVFIIFPGKQKTETYSDDPKDWVDDLPEGVKSIDIDEMTKGDAYISGTNQQYDDGKVMTSFAFDGLYKGNRFSNIYEEEGRVLMAITERMKPKNEIIEGFIVEYIDGGKIIANIFIDSDFREETGDKTNIVWGKTFQNIKEFEFNEISSGIYMDTIIDDNERFGSNYNIHEGGVVVGNMDLDDIRDGNSKDLTVIRIN